MPIHIAMESPCACEVRKNVWLETHGPLSIFERLQVCRAIFDLRLLDSRRRPVLQASSVCAEEGSSQEDLREEALGTHGRQRPRGRAGGCARAGYHHEKNVRT